MNTKERVEQIFTEKKPETIFSSHRQLTRKIHGQIVQITNFQKIRKNSIRVPLLSEFNPILYAKKYVTLFFRRIKAKNAQNRHMKKKITSLCK